MAINYPTTLDTLTNPTGNDRVDTVDHAGQHADANDAVEALEAKVGADSSAVTSSHDYKLSGVTGTDKAASLATAETLLNKTLTAPDINGGTVDDADITNPTLNGTVELDLGSDAEGDLYVRDAAGELDRLGIGTAGQILTALSGLPAWADVNTAGISIETTTGSTHSLTTTGSELVVVFAKGSLRESSNGYTTINLQYNSVTKDSVSCGNSNDSATIDYPFALMYTETPTAGTRDITISAGSNTKIIVFKLAI